MRISTDARREMRPSLVMSPTAFEISIPHAIAEFEQEAAFMAETGNTQDLAGMMGKLVEALDRKAEAHATAERPKIPNWLTTIVIGVAVSVLIGLPAAFVQYGTLQNRISN